MGWLKEVRMLKRSKPEILFLCCMTIVLLFPIALHAGQIYGSVTEAGRGVANATIEIKCGNAPVTQGQTANDGSYRINVTEQGQCLLTLSGCSAAVFSYPDPSQYDFEIVRYPNGGCELRRK